MWAKSSHPRKMVRHAWVVTIHFFGINRKTLVFAVFALLGWPLLYWAVGKQGAMEELWARVTLGFSPFVVLAVILFFWNLARASVLVQQSLTNSPPQAEYGILDYRVLVPKAVRKLSKVLIVQTRAIKIFTPKLEEAASRMAVSNAPNKQLKLANKIARVFEQETDKSLKFLAEIRELISLITKGYERMQRDGDMIHPDLFSELSNVLDGALSSIRNYEGSMEKLRDLNLSSKITAASGQLSRITKDVANEFERLQQLAKNLSGQVPGKGDSQP